MFAGFHNHSPLLTYGKTRTHNLITGYCLSTWLFRFFKDVMQSARKSGPDDNIDDFLGYIEIPVKVHTVQHSIFNKVTQQAKLLKKRTKKCL